MSFEVPEIKNIQNIIDSDSSKFINLLKAFESGDLNTAIYIQEISQNNDKHEWRKEYLNKLYEISKNWLLFIGVAIILSGFKDTIGFDLSNTVLITLITTSTVTVLGLFTTAALWLFDKDKNNKK